MRAIAALVPVAGLFFGACATTHDANWKETPAQKDATADDATKADALLAEGDALWAERASEEKLKGALAKWEEAAKMKVTGELAVKLSRAHYLLGDGYYALADNAAGRDAEYQLGLDWATTALKIAAPEFAAAMAGGQKHSEAIKLAPKEAVPAMYWYASNLGKWASTKGFTTVLKYKDDIKATMDHVKALDEAYFYGGPYRYFGAFEARTSGIAGGSLEKSKENFQKAVTMAPNYLGTKVLWAEFLCTKQQDRDMYKKLLEEVIAADASVDPEIVAENKIEQEKAKKLLAKIDDNF